MFKNQRVLSGFQPAGDTHPRNIGFQYLMEQFIALKKNEFAVFRRYTLLGLFLINAQLSTIGFLPIGVEIHDHRILPTVVVAKLIEVFFVETPFFVKGVMKFVISNTCIASGIQKQHKSIHEFEKFIFERIVMQTVEPVNAIAPIVLILMNNSAVAGSGLMKFIFRKRCYQIFFQMKG